MSFVRFPVLHTLAAVFGFCLGATAADYVILVSSATRADADWRKVVDTLAERHPGARILEFTATPGEKAAALRAEAPRHLCWVARPVELGKEPVAALHGLARGLDDDPFTDVLWGIVTGRNASAAMSVASPGSPLVVRRVVSGTEFAMECVEEGKWFSELDQGVVWQKDRGAQPRRLEGEADSTASIARAFGEENPDAILTSGHATEKDWEPGFRYKNGRFIHRDGVITGLALDGGVHPVRSDHAKVYLGIGNCLIANVPGQPECMATAWMASGGVKQFFGYTVPTWFGYGGWGVLDYWLEQPGRFTLTEAVFANLHALDARLAGKFGELNPMDKRGLAHDRDTIVLLGDPAWEARLAPGPLRWDEQFDEVAPGQFTWTITPKAGEETFSTVNTNGSQRGGRPLVRFLPRKASGATLLEGEKWNPVLGDDFILIPRPSGKPETMTLRIQLREEPRP